jgi:hypothetical protein
VDRAHPDASSYRGRERREALALERAAEDEVQRVGEGGEPAQGGRDVGRLGVVDEAHAVVVANELEAVRHAGEGSQRLTDDGVVQSQGAGHRGGGRGVLAVMFARDARFRGQGVRGRELEPLRRSRHRLEATRHDGEVVGELVLEHAQLRPPVRVHGAVAVEVVGLEVEQHGGSRPELVDVLELERGHLADDAGARSDLAVELAERPPDVPCNRGAEHRAEQFARRRLAVRAGDRDDVDVRQQAVAELDLAPHRNAAGPRGPHGRRLARHSRALDHELHCLHHVLVLDAQSEFDACGGKPPHVEVGPPVDADHAHASAGERERRRPPRPREADDERRGGQLHARKDR